VNVVEPSPQADPSIHAQTTAPQPWWRRFGAGVREFFLGDEFTVGVAVVPLCFLSMLLFTRHPMKTNFIFDEQEALLANPYVRSVADAHTKIRWIDAFYRDFWGLPPDRSIGSYRPIPDLLWRGLWALGARDQTPFLHHWVNVLLHGVNGALLALIVQRVTRDRLAAWLSGALFVGCALLTEAVSGVVGIADVLGGLGALLAVMALALPMPVMPMAVFLATLFGLYSKESALCVVPLVPFVALMTSQITHPHRPMRIPRALLAALATGAAFVFYVEARRRMFPTPMARELTDPVIAAKPHFARVFAKLLRWYAQPALPKDPLNNPLVDASFPYRVAGAMRVYARGLGQILFPWRLSGDYSAPQEPVPSRLIFPESVLGAALTVGPLLASVWLGVAAWRRVRRAEREERAMRALAAAAGDRAPTLKSREHEPIDLRPVVGAAMVWIVVSYFPVSNIPVVLPTVRAERFWYFPALGSSVLLALLFTWLLARARRWHLGAVAWLLLLTFVGFQAFAARRHANDYTDDLVFWNATRHAVPRSAKAHLNYSVMQGARGNLEARADANRTALDLAPNWPMANVYMGDTLCRLHRTEEAWPHYERGFDLAPNDTNLIALGIQCLWDERALDEGTAIRQKLEEVGEKHPGSWLEFLERDTLENGTSHNGVDPKYRPRGYNEGPKSE
jgi:hypothetical protein